MLGSTEEVRGMNLPHIWNLVDRKASGADSTSDCLAGPPSGFIPKGGPIPPFWHLNAILPTSIRVGHSWQGVALRKGDIPSGGIIEPRGSSCLSGPGPPSRS